MSGSPAIDEALHSALVTAAATWLERQGCALVITDMSHGGSETADAIGWRRKFSILVECKASRADFRADSKKPFRREPAEGMGVLRYFCTPRGLVSVEEIPVVGSFEFVHDS